VGLSLLVVSRKAMRDRRESASARRRRRYRRALATGDRRALRRVLGSVRAREAQVDLAAVLQDELAERPDVAVLDREARRSGLTARLQTQLGARTGPARGRAVLILSHPRLPQGVDRLEPMLDDDDPDVRLVAVAGLPLGEDPEAIPALVRALSKRRLAPERVIERLGQPWAVESLLQALRDLDAAGERRAAPRVGVARALGHAGDRRAGPAMIDLLRRGSLEERISAARTLGSVGGRRSRGELERALVDESWPLRAQAARALGTIGIRRSVPALEAVLDDPAWWVRANAASALRGLGRPGRAALERALDHPDRYARDRAREALAMDRVATA
jgi:HEAT repeat protein